ncbi:zinc finger BED domain-containing protein RICESLEEPER 2 [Tanacetum coccineum]
MWRVRWRLGVVMRRLKRGRAVVVRWNAMVEDGGLMCAMSEFVALAATCKEAEWLKNLLLEIPVWVKPIAPISIRCDSAATLAKAYSQMYNGKSRHLGVRHSMIRELITNGVVSIEFVRSQQNLADHLTKGLARDLVIKSAEGVRLKGLKHMFNDGGDVASLFSRDYIPIKSLRFEHSAFLEGPGESLGGVEGPAEEIGLVEIPREATVEDSIKPTAADHSQLGKYFPRAVDIPCHKALYFLHEFGLLAYTVPHFHGESHDETNEDDENNKKNENKNNGNKRKRKPSGGIGNEKADYWKYFDPKMERPDRPNGPLVKMAHYDDWVMHKRVINFKRINSHRGEDIGRVLLKCINGWGIKNVMTITVDNITLNDTALKYLIEHLPSMYDNGKHFHIRCMAHIINLVVKDGLKVHPNEVETIGLAVKYIKSSSQRIEKFKGCIKNTCDSNRFLITECPTRWNSTYDMLKSAIDLQDAFYNYSMKNASFSRDLNAIPRRTDFDILDIDKHLREWEFVPKLDKMVSKMRLKYDKYWGDYKKINHYMYFAVLLDPTMKSEVLGYGFRHLMENGCIPEENEDEENTPLEFLTDNEKEDKVKQLVYEVETNIGVLFALYNEKYGTKLTNNSSDVHKSSSTQSRNTTRRRGNTFLNSFKSQNTSRSIGGDDELKIYLKEPILELDDGKNFDILFWWKINSPRFPIVSKMTKGNKS